MLYDKYGNLFVNNESERMNVTGVFLTEQVSSLVFKPELDINLQTKPL